MEQTVLERSVFDLDVFGQVEPALERARRDALV
jgi:hypothetical protein